MGGARSSGVSGPVTTLTLGDGERQPPPPRIAVCDGARDGLSIVRPTLSGDVADPYVSLRLAIFASHETWINGAAR